MACSSFVEAGSGTEPATDGGGGDAGGGTEASPPDDASQADATGLSDAYLFFDDFDDDSLANGPWNDDVSAGGSYELSDAAAKSPPLALLIRADGGVSNAGLSWRWPAHTGRLRLSFDLYVVTPPSGSPGFLSMTRVDGLPTVHSYDDDPAPLIALSGQDGGKGTVLSAFNLRQVGSPVGYVLGVIPPGTWTHVETSVLPHPTDPTKSNVRWQVEGNAALERTVDRGSVGAPPFVPFTFFGTNSGAIAVEVLVDNVKIDLR